VAVKVSLHSVLVAQAAQAAVAQVEHQRLTDLLEMQTLVAVAVAVETLRQAVKVVLAWSSCVTQTQRQYLSESE
jgi:TPP-dependent indolepyruvate ferredoxin oxidoreductase alpha subunit